MTNLSFEIFLNFIIRHLSKNAHQAVKYRKVGYMKVGARDAN